MWKLNKVVGFLLLLITSPYCLSANINPVSVPLEIGGSNYPTYDVQGYLNSSNPPGAWFVEDNIKIVIGDYHLNPSQVKSQLRTMYSNGQRKIGLIIWHEHFPSNRSGNTYGNRIRSNAYRLPTQQKNNLVNILREIKSIGYNEIVLRFGPQVGADPTTWSAWNENQFQENWNFIYNTVNTMESTLGSSVIKRFYDLGVELGGRNEGQNSQYQKVLWGNFQHTFPSLSSIFTIAYHPGRLDKLIKDLKQAGPLPSEYRIDLNSITAEDAPMRTISTIKQELNQNGEAHKAIVIQETAYNDPLQFDRLMDAISANDLKVRYIMQWPYERDGYPLHFSVDYPKLYNNYAKPYLYAAGSGCSDRNCIWITGQNFEPNKAFVDIRHPTNGSLVGRYYSNDISHYVSHAQGNRVITLRLRTTTERNLFATQGLKIYVVNPTFSQWADGRIVRR